MQVPKGGGPHWHVRVLVFMGPKFYKWTLLEGRIRSMIIRHGGTVPPSPDIMRSESGERLKAGNWKYNEVTDAQMGDGSRIGRGGSYGGDRDSLSGRRVGARLRA